MKYSVLTYVFNGYEIPREVQNPDPDVEYIMVTDDENTKLNTWKVIVDHDLDGLSPFDKCYAVRFNCFKYATTDICIRIDGSIEIVGSLDYLVDKLNEGGYVGAIMVHP